MDIVKLNGKEEKYFSYLCERDSVMERFDYARCRSISEKPSEIVRKNLSNLTVSPGIKEFTAVLAGMIYEIVYDDADTWLVPFAVCLSEDFETGEYDYMLKGKDPEHIKSDIAFVKEYVWSHFESVCSEALRLRKKKYGKK